MTKNSTIDSSQITLEKSLQAYRVISAPSSESWKVHYVEERFSSDDLTLCSESERTRFSERLKECPISIASSIKQTKGLIVGSLDDVVRILMDEKSNRDIKKIDRRVIYSTDSEDRPIGKKAFELWNGFQVIDMDIKNPLLARKLKYHIFNKLHKCNWFFGAVLSSSGKGLHIYTKISIPESDRNDPNKMKLLFLTNFRHKYSFVYISCLDAMEENQFTKDDLMEWMDLSMFKPQQGAFIGYDPHPLINTNFFEDFIYMDYDAIDRIGHPEIDWVTYPDLREVFRRWEWFDGSEDDAPNIDVESVNGPDISGSQTKIHYKHNERWRLANTLVKLFGFEQGTKYMRQICSNDISSKEIQGDCSTAHRHNKSVDIWAVNRLNQVHGFRIKLGLQASNETEEDLYKSMEMLGSDNPNLLGIRSKQYSELYITKDQFLSNIQNDIMDICKRNKLVLLEAGPGLGKTELVKGLVSRFDKKIMLVMPFTSTIKSKVEKDKDWYYSYGGRKPRLDVEKGLVLTLDKFSRLNMMQITASGFDYIIIDESHLLFMSEYRSIMSDVVDMICHSEIPVILMTGTPTGELIFFPDIYHIKVIKEETRQKELHVRLVNTQDTLLFHMCRSMADDIAKGKRILFPSNNGTLFSKSVQTGIRYFLEKNHAIFEDPIVRYYKKSELGEKFMDDVNFEKTINDIQVLMCTSYLSVGVDILDRFDFEIYFADLFTASEVDQWANRLRQNDLRINLFVAKHDSDGNPRYLNRFQPINFKLSGDEIRDVHSLLQICNNMIERNPEESKYNIIVSNIVHNNNYIRFDECSNKYVLNETAYKIVQFERRYRKYAQQLPVIMGGMRSYGYKVIAEDLCGDSGSDENELLEMKNLIKLSGSKERELNSKYVEELLGRVSEDRLEIYREVLHGGLEIRKGYDWKEDVLNRTITVKSAEIFEKVIPPVLSMSKYYGITTIREIFEFCRNTESGNYNFAALGRIRTLINLQNSLEGSRLDLPIQKFMEGADKFIIESIDGKRTKNEIDRFINDFTTKYAHLSSSTKILIEQSTITMKFLGDVFNKLFRCLVKVGKPDGLGQVSLKKIELLWKKRGTGGEDAKELNDKAYLLQDFFSIN